jgi:hypothetical protein
MKELNSKSDVSFHKFGGVPDNIPTNVESYKGVERVSHLENGWFNRIANMDNTFFNHASTDTVMIKNALETLPQGIPIHLIFECDGIFRSGTVPLARILQECAGKLQNIKKVTLIFSPWTPPAQIEILTREIKLVVNTIASSIKFESKLLPKSIERNVLTTPQAVKDAYNTQISGITRDIYTRGKTSTIVLPPSFYSFESFMIHRDLTPESIIKLLNIIEPREKINFINEMINLLISTITTNPILLNIEGNIYQMLHSIARLIQNHTFTPEAHILQTIARFAEEDGRTFKISRAYFNWLSAYNDQRNDDEIRKLINESKISKQEVKYTEFILRKNCIGYFYYRDNRDVGNLTVERIAGALNRPERSDTFSLFNLLIQELFFVPKTDEMVVRPGFFICPEDNNPSLVSLCLSSFFMPFKYSSLNNLVYSQLAMYTYSTDKLIVNLPFMRICVKYCLNLLNDDNLFKNITGYDTSNPNNFSNIRDIWYIYHNSELLYRFLILIPQVYKEKYNKLTEYFSKIFRLNNIYSKCNASLTLKKKVYTIRRRTAHNITTIREGSIIHVSDGTWNNGRCININESDCPWKSLPAIVKILERCVVPGDGHVLWKCEYFDHKLGTGDTFRIRQGNLTEVLSFTPLRDDLEKALNQYLITERVKDGERNPYYVSSGGRPRNVRLHAERLVAVKNITEQNEIIIEERVQSEVPVNKSILLELVNFPQSLKTLLEAPSLSKQLIIANMDNEEISEAIRNASHFRPGTASRKIFNYNSKDYELEANEITAFLQEFHSKLVPVRESTGSQLKIDNCAICTDYISSTENIDSFKLPCNHIVCTSCKNRLSSIDYKRGDFLDKVNHACNLCRKFVSPTIFPGLTNKWWSPILAEKETLVGCVTKGEDADGHRTYWRFCEQPGCTLEPLFNAKANAEGCDLEDDQLPSKCPKHNLVTGDLPIRFCPNCKEAVMKWEFCDILTCCPKGTGSCYASRYSGCDHAIRNKEGKVSIQLCGTAFCYWCLKSFGQFHIQANHDAAYEHCGPSSTNCEYKNRKVFKDGPDDVARGPGGAAYGTDV